MHQEEYNIEAYKFIRQEIDKRIDIHYKFVMWKIVVGGAMIAFLLDKGKSIPVSPYIITPIFLYLMDIIILENLGHIKSAGSYIKKNIETFEGNDFIIKWESDFAQMDGNWGCFTSFGYIFGIWIIAPLIMTGGLFFDFDYKNKVDIFTYLIGFYLTIFSMIMIFQELNADKESGIKKSKSPLSKEYNKSLERNI